MQKQAPSVGRILVMVLFALSCFGLLLFLWVAFGGSTPLRPEGYRFVVPFKEAGQLAQEADVRISGVSVGKVKSIEADPQTGNSNAVVELEPRYAPIPRDSRVMLRQKTLLGETYVELTPGSPDAPKTPDGGALPEGDVAPTVELDEILRSFDEPTRKAFGVWQQQQAIAGAGRGRDINDAFAQFAPLEEQATSLLTVLNENERDLSALVSNTGEVFSALSARGNQLADLVTNSNEVFETIGARNEQLAQTFVALPAFQRESRETLDRLVTFANDTNPLVDQLKPVAQELDPTMRDLAELSPDLRNLFVNLDPAISASVDGLPAVNQFLEDAAPFLGDLDPTLAQLNPVLQYIGAFPNEITSWMANVPASTQAQADVNGRQLKYLRTTNPLSPEALANYPRRVKSNRPNPYTFPQSFSKLPTANMPVFQTSQCTSGITAGLAPNAADVIGQTLVDRINQFAFAGQPPTNVPAPQCPQQGKQTVQGVTTQYPQVRPGSRPAAPSFGTAP
jgi:virulence factor Mce-like protein